MHTFWNRKIDAVDVLHISEIPYSELAVLDGFNK